MIWLKRGDLQSCHSISLWRRHAPLASHRHCERSAATQIKSHASGSVHTNEPSLEGFLGSSKEDPIGINASPIGEYILDPSLRSG